MYKELQQFIDFCFKHGGFLKNHREFGEMSNALLGMAATLEIKSSDEIVKKTIILHERREEYLVAVQPSFDGKARSIRPETPHMFVLVYRYEGRKSENEYVYTLSGARLQ